MSKIVVFRNFYVENGDNSTVFGNVIGKSRGGVGLQEATDLSIHSTRLIGTHRQRCSNHETEVSVLYNLVDFP